MKRRKPDVAADPFEESTRPVARRALQLLGARFEFESNHRALLRLVDHAYANLPAHRLTRTTPRIVVRLRLTRPEHSRSRGEPALIQTLSGAGLLCGATGRSDCALISPEERAALIVVSPDMLRYPYHLRYELIEFSVATLAARVQGLVPLHAACFGRAGRGLLLIGASGAGKTTLSLHSLLSGLEFIAEDSLFVAPDTLLATGAANFLHVRRDALHFLPRATAARLERAPVITRRGGARKFELDLRGGRFALAPTPLRIAATVFVTARAAGRGALLRPLERRTLLENLTASQPYASTQANWALFTHRIGGIPAFELRRGGHPAQAIDALRGALEASANPRR
jgi:hypothetical protein